MNKILFVPFHFYIKGPIFVIKEKLGFSTLNKLAFIKVYVPVVPKSNLNRVEIGSRTERLRVLQKKLSVEKSIA